MHTEVVGGKKCEKKFNNFLAQENQRSIYFASYLYLPSLGADMYSVYIPTIRAACKQSKPVRTYRDRY
jgi:hypothetical protein